MPAFPGGWQFKVANVGLAAAQVVIPAASGNIRRILSDLKGQTFTLGGGAGIYAPTLQVFDGATLIFDWTLAIDLASAGASDSYDDAVILIGSPGVAMTIRFSGPATAITGQQIRVKGYDL